MIKNATSDTAIIGPTFVWTVVPGTSDESEFWTGTVCVEFGSAGEVCVEFGSAFWAGGVVAVGDGDVDVEDVVAFSFFEEVIGSTVTGTVGTGVKVLVTVTVAGGDCEGCMEFSGGIGFSDSDGIFSIDTTRLSTPCAETKLNANIAQRINLRVV